MQALAEAFRKIAMLFRRRQIEADLEEEMRFHLEMRASEQREDGVGAAEAAQAARRRFGNATLVREAAREAWTWPSAESLLRDVRLAGRSLRRSPAFVAVSLASLALGIGVNVAIFSFVNGLFLRPIPAVPGSDRLVSIFQRYRAGAQGFTSSSYPDFEYYRTHSRSFSGVVAYTGRSITVRAGDHAEFVNGEIVSPNYFAVLGVTPAAGRLFASTGKPVLGGDPVVVISYQFWQRRFGADPAAIGRRLQVGTTRLTVVGVAQRGFQGLDLQWAEAPALWVPVGMYREAAPELADGDFLGSWGAQTYNLVARLKPGATFGQAAADMKAVGQRIFADNPEREQAWPRQLVDRSQSGVELYPTVQSRLWPGDRDGLMRYLALLAACAILIFALACFNVANLVLARSARRRHELAVRLSIGASRARIVRQMLVENLLLASAGTAAGLLVARATTAALLEVGRVHFSLSVDTAPDGRVLAVAAAAAIACGLALTVLPARLASRTDINAVAKSESAATGTPRLRAQNALVAVQVAVSVVLLVGAGLFVRTLRNAQATDVTRRPDQVLLTSLDLSSAAYDEARGRAFQSQLLERLRSLPDVADAAFVFVVPLGGRRGGTNVVLEPRTPGEARTPVQVGFNVVTPGYFRMIGLTVTAGRDFTAGDREGGVPVAVINEVMARRLFPGRNPIGERFLLQWPPASTVEVVGVVRDGRFRDYRADVEATVYVPLAQRYFGAMNLEVRARGGVAPIVRAVVGEVAALDSHLALGNARTLQAHLDAALAQERLSAFLLSGLGLLALMLSALGVYGVLSYSVGQRTREIGMRIALGAPRRAVIAMVIGGVMRLMAAGVGVGVVASAIGARLVRQMLFGVEPYDLGVFAFTVAVLACVAALAAWLPARRASKVDPVVALRHE